MGGLSLCRTEGIGQWEANAGVHRCPPSLSGLICSVGRRLPASQGL